MRRIKSLIYKKVEKSNAYSNKSDVKTEAHYNDLPQISWHVRCKNIFKRKRFRMKTKNSFFLDLLVMSVKALRVFFDGSIKSFALRFIAAILETRVVKFLVTYKRFSAFPKLKFLKNFNSVWGCWNDIRAVMMRLGGRTDWILIRDYTKRFRILCTFTVWSLNLSIQIHINL